MARRKAFQCKGTAKLTLANNEFVGMQAHNHTTDDKPVIIQNILSKVKAEVRASKKETVSEVFKRVTRHDQIGKTIELGDYKEGFYKRKRAGTPNVPKNIQAMIDALEDADHAELAKYYTETLYLPNGDIAGVVFSHPTLIAGFSRAKHFSYDGTYYTVPKLFKQNFIVMFEAHSHYFPALMSLLTGHTEEHYLAVFRLLLRMAPDFEGCIGMGDFEKASRKAGEAILGHIPGLCFKGCFFHYCNCIVKHLRSCKLMKKYMKNVAFYQWARKVMAIPLLPPNLIIPTWNDLRLVQFFDAEPVHRRSLDKFKNYVTNTWIGRIGVNGRWVGGVPVEVLSVFGLHQATNNPHESFNGKMKSTIIYKNPTAWKFLYSANDILLDKANEFENLENDPTANVYRKVVSASEEKIKLRREAERKLLANEYTAEQFLDVVSISFKSHVDELNRQYRIVQLQERVNDPDFAESEDSENEDDYQGPTCNVCLGPRTENWALIPCGHQEFCHPCVQMLSVQNPTTGGPTCPQCRTVLTTPFFFRTFGAAV